MALGPLRDQLVNQTSLLESFELIALSFIYQALNHLDTPEIIKGNNTKATPRTALRISGTTKPFIEHATTVREQIEKNILNTK